jgi:hypothetical protein
VLLPSRIKNTPINTKKSNNYFIGLTNNFFSENKTMGMSQKSIAKWQALSLYFMIFVKAPNINGYHFVKALFEEFAGNQGNHQN